MQRLMARGVARYVGLGLLLLPPPAPLRAEDDVVMKAMRDELSRAMESLQLKGLAKPYFISYKVRKITTTEASASFGSLTGSSEQRSRTLGVMVRVGDYTLDNTNFLSMPFGSAGVVHNFPGNIQLPLEDDYKEIRRQIWLATDSAYKKALEDLSRKRAMLETNRRAEDIPDFSREEPQTTIDQMPVTVVSRAEAESLVRSLSSLFMEMPDVFSSSVRLQVLNFDTRYVSSEGTSFTRIEPGVLFRAVARTQAIDGVPLEDFVAAYGRSMQDLRKEDLTTRIKDMGTRLQKLRKAPLLDHYSGPVLIEGQAAAELFSQVFAPKLLAIRRPVSDNPQLGMFFSQEDTFLDRIGARVMPDFLTVVDNPLLDQYNQVRLVGGYKVDDEGIRARENVLVEKGILKTLLTARDPVPGIMHSTGNNQGGLGPTPSNLIVKAENGLTADELRARLLNLVKQRGKDYGVIISRVSNPLVLPSVNQLMSLFLPPGMGDHGKTVIVAIKVFADGHEELIRNAELAGLSTAAFKDIVAASKDQNTYSTEFLGPGVLTGFFSGANPAEAGGHILSFVVPSLLFEDLSLRKPTGEIPNLPVAGHPFFGK